ncbi:MAG TPA: hypothetical protein VFZ11_07435 [Gemmatimonadaceae bacterium]
MLSPTKLLELTHELAGTRVLSVYLETKVTDPAMRNAWRPALAAAIRSARASATDERDLAELERAAAHLDEPEHMPGGAWAAPGWVAFVTADGVRYVADLPVTPPTLAAWRDGPFVSPYMRALKQHRAVIVAVVESGAARLYRYAWRKLEPLGEMHATEEDGRGGKASSHVPRGSAYPAARGAVGTESADRRRRDAFHRMAVALGQRIAHLAGDDGWVLVGGTPEWSKHARDALPRPLEGRVLVSSTLDHDASEDAIAREARHAATELRAAHGQRLVDRLLERAGGHGRAAAGIPAVQRALHARAVDLLLVTPEVVNRHPEDAEELVRAALAQGADVEVLSEKAAEKLNEVAEGVGARLRFPIEETMPSEPPEDARAALSG